MPFASVFELFSLRQEPGGEAPLLGGVGLSFTSLGKSFIEGTKEVFEQVGSWH